MKTQLLAISAFVLASFAGLALAESPAPANRGTPPSMQVPKPADAADKTTAPEAAKPLAEQVQEQEIDPDQAKQAVKPTEESMGKTAKESKEATKDAKLAKPKSEKTTTSVK
jgi:hypothetical protein